MIWKVLRVMIISAAIIFASAFIGKVLSHLLEKHANYEYFYEALDANPDTKAISEWTDKQPSGRQFFDNDRKDIADKIVEAWQGYSTALKLDDINYLKDHFTDTALERGIYALESTIGEDRNMAFLGMTIDPAVYHFDGTIFQLKSNDALFARFKIVDEKLMAYQFTEDCIVAVMKNQQTGWKISNFEQNCTKKIDIKPKRKFNANLPKLKGINYYPKNSPWSFFWTDYNPFIVNPDLEHMRALGANSVRIFLPYEVFINEETSEDALENLEIFLNETEDYGLYVIPTLFDFRGDLSPETWPSDRYYLEKILPMLGKYNHIPFVDLKNELDLDEKYQNPALVEAWALTMIGLSRRIEPNLPYTLGWSNAKTALNLSEYLDVISYHDYENISQSRAKYEKIKSHADGKPVYITEIGETSYTLALNLPFNEEKQAKRLHMRLNQFENSDGVFIWTLYDYPVLDPKAVTGSFWHKGIQKNFGLMDEFERSKPAYHMFKNWEFTNE